MGRPGLRVWGLGNGLKTSPRKVTCFEIEEKPLIWKSKCNYRTGIRTTSYNGCKSWTVHGKSEMVIDSFERKILRRMWGPVKKNDRWRLSYNNE